MKYRIGQLVIALCLGGLLASDVLASVENIECTPTNYTIDSESDYVNFSADTEFCGIVRGNVTITGQLEGDGNITISLSELRGELRVINSNVRVIRSDGYRDVGDSRTLGLALKKLGGLHIENNDDLVNAEFSGLEAPPPSIFAHKNADFGLFDLTPDTPPASSNSPIILEGDWIFTENALNSGPGILLGFSNLQLHLTGDLLIQDNARLSGEMFDFSGLRSVRDLKITGHRSSLGATLGQVTYGEDEYGDAKVFVTGGFKDLVEARNIEVNQSGFTDVSFPMLERVESLFVWEYGLGDVNAPKVTEIGTLRLDGLGTNIGPNIGDRTGWQGRGWGLGRLKTIKSLLWLWFESVSDATGLDALNIVSSNNLSIQDGAGISIGATAREFSLAGIKNIASNVWSIDLQNHVNSSYGFRPLLTDLDAFESIQTVEQSVWIRGLDFTNLAFLKNVRSIGTDLVITNDSYHYLNPANGSLDGIESIQSIGGNLEVSDFRMENCHALLPLIGWGTAANKVAGNIEMTGNEPASCNSENIGDLKQEAMPEPFSADELGPDRGGVFVKGFLPANDLLFPPVKYEAICRASYSESTIALPGSTFPVPANTKTSLSLAFEKAGRIEDVRVQVNFKTVDQSQLTISLDPPAYKAVTLWNKEGTETTKFIKEFNDANSALWGLRGTSASGDWTMDVHPGGSSAQLNSFRIDIDSLFRSSIDASTVSSNFVSISIPDMPPGDSFDCQLSAINEFGLSTDTSSQPVATPPTISDTPTIISVEPADGGILVHFDPTNYWGSLWFGSVTYVATCDEGLGVTNSLASSLPVISSPAFIEGLDAESNLNCRVSIDNVYEEKMGAVFLHEPVLPSLPIWLLYEASQE